MISFRNCLAWVAMIVISCMLSGAVNADDACVTYRLVYKTVYDEVKVTSYRLQHETVYDQQKVTTYRPQWTTETRERRYRVAKPIVETEFREEKYQVLRPRWEPNIVSNSINASAMKRT